MVAAGKWAEARQRRCSAVGMQEQGPCWAGRALLGAGASPHPLPAWQPWGQQVKPLSRVGPDLESGWMNKTAFFFLRAE